MKFLKYYLPLLTLTLFFGFTSCKKKCVVEDETLNSGSIIKNVIFYPTSGYQTGNMGGNYVINANHPYANSLEISIDGGGRIPVNFSNYTVLCYPIAAKCNATYDRTVTINHTNQTAVYKIIVTQCSNCEEIRTTENYVLVPAIPSNYFVSFDVSIVEK